MLRSLLGYLGYLPFHQFHCMLIRKAGNVQAISYHLDDHMAVFMHEAGDVYRPLFCETLHRFVPLPHVLW